MSYLIRGTDLRDQFLVKLAHVAVEATDVERLLDAGRLPARQASPVHRVDPSEVVHALLGGYIRLEADDPFPGHDTRVRRAAGDRGHARGSRRGQCTGRRAEDESESRDRRHLERESDA